MIAVIGAGAMGEALMAGWIAAGTSPDEIVAGLPLDSYFALRSPSIRFSSLLPFHTAAHDFRTAPHC